MSANEIGWLLALVVAVVFTAVVLVIRYRLGK